MVVASEPSLFFMFNLLGLSFLSLSVEVESGAVLPLGLLHNDQNLLHPEAPDEAVIGSHNCDGGPTPDIPACPGVGFPPLCGEAARQALQLGLLFCGQHAVYRDDKRRKVETLLQTGFNVLKLLVYFCHLQALLRSLLKVICCICVHHMHV